MVMHHERDGCTLLDVCVLGRHHTGCIECLPFLLGVVGIGRFSCHHLYETDEHVAYTLLSGTKHCYIVFSQIL
jgi:hypothetical protein